MYNYSHRDLILFLQQIPPDVVYDNRVLMSSEIKCQVEPDGIGCPVCSVIFERIILCSIDKSSKSQQNKTLSILHSHITFNAFLLTGFFPIGIAPATVISVFDSDNLRETDLMYSFLSFLTEGEQQTAREALQKRHVCVDDSLIDILSRFNVRTIPSTMAEFNSLFLRIARCEFVTKPSVLMAAFKQGMLETHPELWSELDANTIRAVYARLDPTPGKVLEIIQTCPDDMPLTAQRERVLEFFRRYIRSLTKDKVAVFLQFITGSNLLLVPKIEVAFTSLAGIQRRPIVHTCTGRIDLSTEYESFAAFSKEINKVLTKDESFEYTAI
ncbi:uncharacterized protein LOC144666540 [Oculina patagonica]